MENLENNKSKKVSLNLIETSGIHPTSIFDIVVDGKKIGKCNVRHTPRKSERMPDGFENHIYYEIFPKFRERGYATETLRLALEEARNIGLEEVIITVDSPNIASIKVIEKNGGVLLEERPDKEGALVRKYKIDL